MGEQTPAPETTMLFCPVCGRDDRFTAFTGKRHWRGGEICAGQPRKVVYVLAPAQSAAAEEQGQ